MSQDRSAGEGFDLGRLVESLLQAGDHDVYRKVSAAVERVVIEAVLRYTAGNRVQASERLGISRTTLRAKLRSLGITIEPPVPSRPGPAGQ